MKSGCDGYVQAEPRLLFEMNQEMYVSPNGVIFVKLMPTEIISSMWTHPSVSKLSLNVKAQFPYDEKDWEALFWRETQPAALERGPMISDVDGDKREVTKPALAPDEREAGSLAQLESWTREAKQRDWQDYI